MGHDWIIAQLDAMVAYAARNDLPALSAALAEARLVAVTEIASLPESGGPPRTGGGPMDGFASYH